MPCLNTSFDSEAPIAGKKTSPHRIRFMYQLVRKFQGEVRALVSDADVVGVAFVPIAESGPCIGCRARLNSHDICAPLQLSIYP